MVQAVATASDTKATVIIGEVLEQVIMQCVGELINQDFFGCGPMLGFR